VKITIDHILWDCKETEIKQLQMNITKEIWKGGNEDMEKLIQYVKEMGLYKSTTEYEVNTEKKEDERK
jgi:hypothetical protein